MKKFIGILLILVLLAVMGCALWQIFGITAGYEAGADSYEALEQFVVMPEKQTGLAGELTSEAESEAIQWPAVDFGALAQVNSDIVGWLYIPGTVINYPLVQGADNDYYLTHLFDGKTNSSGCIFLDSGAAGDFSSMNSVLHGHHMKNGSMFAGICDYKSQEYYDAHPTGMLLTPAGNFEVRFFAGYVCATDNDAWNSSFSAADHGPWLEERIRSSCFDAEVTPATEDKVLTLSTCSYEFKDARFVLHGILVPA